MDKLYFLSGMPRTGTTVLSSILNQNPNIHCTSTSGMLDFLAGVDSVYYEISKRYSDINPNQIKNIFKSIAKSYYNHVDENIVVDKWRGWAANINQIKEIIDPNPKIICTYRPIEEIITSFLFLLEQDSDNFVDKNLIQNRISITNENRALYLWNEGVVGECYFFIKKIINDKNILFVSYQDLVNIPFLTLEKIYNYWELDMYKHNFINLKTKIDDNDDHWQLKNLHVIRSKIKLEYKNPQNFLSEKFIKYFQSFNEIYKQIK